MGAHNLTESKESLLSSSLSTLFIYVDLAKEYEFWNKFSEISYRILAHGENSFSFWELVNVLLALQELGQEEPDFKILLWS